MRDSIYRISLDIHNVASQVQITAKKNDSSRKIYITLNENGTPYIPDSGCNAIIMIDRPGSSILTNECELDDGQIVYEFNEYTASFAGVNECEVRLIGEDDEIITSPKFTMLVIENVYEDGQSHGVSHQELQGRDSANQHSISSITGLTDALNGKGSKTILDSTVSTLSDAVSRVNILEKKVFPTLDSRQKQVIKNILNSWLGARTDCMEYKSGSELDDFTDGSCFSDSNGKLQLSCNTFVSNIMMGRSVTDYIVNGLPKQASQYSPRITSYGGFDFGFYPKFKGREFYKVAYWGSSSLSPAIQGQSVTGYYGLMYGNNNISQSQITPDTDLTKVHSVNTYYHVDSNQLNKQVFKSYLNANDLAKELEEMGCVVPISEMDAGDIVFFSNNDGSPFHEYGCYKNIGHVAIIREMRNGFPVFVHASGSNAHAINAFSMDASMSWSLRMYALALHKDIVMVCRMPVAFGYEANVPDSITIPNN